MIRISGSRNLKTFLKFLVSYILVLIIPVIVFSIILNTNLMITIKDGIISSNKRALRLSQSSIDREIRQMHGVSYRLLYTNKYLSDYFGMPNGNDRNSKIRNELRESILTNLFISEIALYTKNEGKIYTSKGNYAVYDFFSKIYRFEDYDTEMFLEDISSIQKLHLIPAQNVNTTERYITALYPSHSFALRPRPGLMFIIQEKKILDYIKPPDDVEGARGIIMDEEYRVIAATDYDDYLYTEAFAEEVISASEASEEYKLMKLDSMDYYMFVNKSEVFQLSYVYLLPLNSMYKKVNEAQVMVGIGLLLIIIVGGIIIYLFMVLNYQPIRQLSLNIQRMFSVSDNTLDEMETVKEGFNYLATQNTDLSNRLEKSLDKVRMAAVLSLIKGLIESRDEFNEYGKDANLHFPYDEICVVMIHVKSEEDIRRSDILRIFEENKSAYGYELYCCDSVEKDQYIVVINSLYFDTQELKEYLEEGIEAAASTINAVLTIGVGNSTDDFGKTPYSYFEGAMALKQRFIQGHNKVIMFELMEKEFNTLDDDLKKLAIELKKQVKKGDKLKIEECINYMSYCINNGHMPIFMVQSYCFDILNDIMSQGEEMPDAFLIESVDTVEELLTVIKETCYKICDIVTASIKEEKDLIGQIITHIEDNCYNCEFSIQGVSDHFNVKLSYLSQYFKGLMNVNIIDYVTDLRVKKAKHLLLTTKLNLSIISEEVGYYNVSSFIRRFKQMTSMSPGEFRKANKDRDE